MYAIGQFYWYGYLGAFGISVELVDLGFERIVTAVWVVPLYAFAMLLGALVHRKEALVTKELSAPILAVWSLGVVSLAIAFAFRPSGWISLLLLGLPVIVVPFLHFNKVPFFNFKTYVPAPQGMLARGLAVLILLTVLSGLAWLNGRAEALDRLAGRAGTCVSVEGQPDLPPRLIVVVRAGSHFFLSTVGAPDRPRVNLMVHEDKVQSAVVRPCSPTSETPEPQSPGS